jgi:hypothetical protein
VVLQVTIAPAALTAVTTAESVSGTKPSSIGAPPFAGVPAT